MLSWQQHDRCHFVSFVMYISSAKFKEYCFNIFNRAAAGVRGSYSAFGLFFFLVLSVAIPKPQRMMSSSANYRPFLRSLGGYFVI